MKWADIHPGAIVYHGLLTHYGKGTVIRIAESIFDKKLRAVIVKFEGRGATSRLRAGQLRKTPNKKKIRQMVKFYHDRGKVAADGGDILILPYSDEKVDRIMKKANLTRQDANETDSQ